MITERAMYERGYGAGQRARATLAERIAASFRGWRAEFAASAHVDYAEELIALERDRLAAEPSLRTFPETRGWPDLIRAERRGFRDGAGAGDLEVAWYYNYYYYTWYRLNTRYLGRPAGEPGCVAIFIRDSAEGGPLYGRCWDVPNSPGLDLQPPRHGPDGRPRLWCKGVSCATFCDEEPEDIFPINAWQVLPDDCRRLPDVVAFLERYVAFWQPHNGIIVDEELNCIAYEKSNCRVSWRTSDNGTAAVAASACVIPAAKAHRDACHQRSLQLRGYDENSPDACFWSGSEARYRRLLPLVDAAAARGPVLADMAAIVTDRAVPYPGCICLAGEPCHPVFPPGTGEWTMRCRASVLHGPNRRTLFWRVEGQQPAFANPPFLIPGDGVTVRDEWRQGTRPLPPIDGPEDILERYRQYEFDYPNYYPA